MVCGTTTFKCDDCGKRFVGPAAEWYATVYIVPVKCPRCGSMHTYPVGVSNFGGLFDPGFYKKIWDGQDMNDKK